MVKCFLKNLLTNPSNSHLREPRVLSRPLLIEPLEERIVPKGGPIPFGLEKSDSQTMSDDPVAHWIGGSGNWSDPTHWDIGVVPNNSGGITYSVVIDLIDSDPIIPVDQSVTIRGLNNSQVIHVAEGTSNIPAVNNSGVIEVTGASASITLSGDVTNTGDMCANAWILKFSATTVQGMRRPYQAKEMWR